MDMVSPRRGEVYLVRLDPTEGSEIQKTRPALIVSPDELNAHLKTVIAAPLTSSLKPNPFRIAVSFAGKEGSIAIHQIRTLDKQRLVKKVGEIDPAEALRVLREMFAE